MNDPSPNTPQETTEANGAAAGVPQALGRAAGDAESGNTASHTCIGRQGGEEDKFRVLWQGLDSLELSYPGEVHKEADTELKRLKALAQSNNARDQVLAQLQIGERVFEVADRAGGRFFAYLLRHPDMRIAVASSKAKRIPLASVTFLNQFLVSVGPVKAEAVARAALASLGNLEAVETVSRCDIAVDIGTNQDIGGWYENAWVTRASRVDRHTVEGVFTGWSLGLGADLSARLYDKLLEIQSKSHKTYFFDLWLAAGWFYGDPVKRLEHQFRRNALHQFHLKTLADVLAALPALWSYATREWTRLAIPNSSDDTKARWPLHPFWEEIQAISWQGQTRTLERKHPNDGAPTDRVLARMFKAVATSVMARDGLSSLESAGEKLAKLVMGELQRREQWEGADAYTMLMEAVGLKRRKYGKVVKKP